MPNRKLIDQLDQAVTQLLATRVVTVATADPELLPLLHIAAELRQLPREDFKARLKSDLQRKSSMATTTELLLLFESWLPPAGFKDAAKAIEFYQNAFGAKETFRFENGRESATPRS